MPRKRGELQYVKLKYIHVNDAYQRPLGEKRVEKLVQEWDDEKAGAITLAKTANRFYVIDGQHRVEAARRRGLDDLPAVVFFNDETNRQAHIFLAVNKDRAALTSAQLFKAAVVSGEPTANAVSALLRRHGFGDGFRAFSAASKAYEMHGGEWLDAFFAVFRRAWPDATNVDAIIINATVLLQQYVVVTGMVLDWERYEYMLERFPQTTLRARIDERGAAWTGQKAGAAAMTIIDCYNSSAIGGSRKGKIPMPVSPSQIARFGKGGHNAMSPIRYRNERKRMARAEAAKAQPVEGATLKPRVHKRVREEAPIVATFGG